LLGFYGDLSVVPTVKGRVEAAWPANGSCGRETALGLGGCVRLFSLLPGDNPGVREVQQLAERQDVVLAVPDPTGHRGPLMPAWWPSRTSRAGRIPRSKTALWRK